MNTEVKKFHMLVCTLQLLPTATTFVTTTTITTIVIATSIHVTTTTTIITIIWYVFCEKLIYCFETGRFNY